MIEVTAAIIELDGKYLAARRGPGQHLAGYWEFPGGKIETGESAEDCLARELAEEFGIEVAVGDKLGESVHDYEDKVIRLTGFDVQHVSGEFVPSDHDEIRWLASDELDSVDWAPADIPLVEQLKHRISINNTARFYQENARDYCDETKSFDMGLVYTRFLEWLPNDGKILDLGCGSGRDTRFFLDRGYDVTSTDASSEIAKVASDLIGKPVLVESYHDLSYVASFDGVWANASLVHCPERDVTDVLTRVINALKPGGVLYMSFKSGDGERVDEFGRFMNDYTELGLTDVVRQLSGVSESEVWSETKLLRGMDQAWVNALVRKAL